jgi:hypothetical protein
MLLKPSRIGSSGLLVFDGSTDLRCQSRLYGDKLGSDGCKQKSCVAPISLASFEKEAGTEKSIVSKRLRDRA